MIKMGAYTIAKPPQTHKTHRITSGW